mmetsp:Transcript_28850/g.81264  ORF Transcript_28850/g.81264 Transcript_28850/m.81264 type:complete len:232 (+) Transcript_28850:121-816(+)
MPWQRAFLLASHQGTVGCMAPCRSGSPLEQSVPPGYLRKPLPTGVARQLCEAARHRQPQVSQTEWFGRRWCDYYKSVSWDLPEAGAVFSSFAFGLLGLSARPSPLTAAAAGRGGPAIGLEAYGVPLPLPASSPVAMRLPAYAAAGWSPGLQEVLVGGLSLLGEREFWVSCAAAGAGWALSQPGGIGGGGGALASTTALSCTRGAGDAARRPPPRVQGSTLQGASRLSQNQL